MKKIDNNTATETDTFTDGDPSAPTPATTLPAWYMNMTQAELVKVVEMAGITLDAAEEGDVLNNQVAEALAVHVAGLNFYTDDGAADDYTLSPVGTGAAENTVPAAYFDGMTIRFIPDNTNTGGAATVNVNGIGDADIKTGAGAGANPAAGALTAGVSVLLEYDLANTAFKTTASTISAASKADMIAETSAAFPDAETFKHGNGVFKALAKVYRTAGTPAIVGGYNASSIVDDGVGIFTLTWGITFDDVDNMFIFMGNSQSTSGQGGNASTERNTVPSITAVKVKTTDEGTPAADDGVELVWIGAVGELA